MARARVILCCCERDKPLRPPKRSKHASPADYSVQHHRETVAIFLARARRVSVVVSARTQEKD